MSVSVGADIESLCSKCGDVWHVVVAKVEEKIVKVQCKECGGYHRYRPPKSKSTGTGTRRGSTSTKSKKKTEVVARIDEPMVAADTSRPMRPYRFSDTYQPGDRIEHPKFGHGVVELCNEPGKMQVFFAEGRRVLALAKPQSKLERPSRFRND